MRYAIACGRSNNGGDQPSDKANEAEFSEPGSPDLCSGGAEGFQYHGLPHTAALTGGDGANQNKGTGEQSQRTRYGQRRGNLIEQASNSGQHVLNPDTRYIWQCVCDGTQQTCPGWRQRSEQWQYGYAAHGKAGPDWRP